MGQSLFVICSACGKHVTTRHGVVFARCVCGHRNEHKDYVPAPHEHKLQKHCVFIGHVVGSMSCGCGPAYHCNFLEKVCSMGRKPPDEWTTAANGLATPDRYQWCGDCEFFQEASPGHVTNAVKSCAICGMPATTICHEHSPLGMCGEPLCGSCKHHH